MSATATVATGGGEGLSKKDRRALARGEAPGAPPSGPPPGRAPPAARGGRGGKALPSSAASTAAPLPSARWGFGHLLLHPATGAACPRALDPAFAAVAGCVTPAAPTAPACVAGGGTSARATALLHAIAAFSESFVVPPGRSLAWELDKALAAQLVLVARVRACAPSVLTAARWARGFVARLPPALPDVDAKARVSDAMTEFVRERIAVQAAIAARVRTRAEGSPVIAKPPSGGAAMLCLGAGDVVVLYGRSAAAEALLMAAHAGAVASGGGPAAPLSVIVIETGVPGEGTGAAQRLADAGVPTMLVPASGAAQALRFATLLLCGCVSVLGDGSVLGRAGQAAVALVASHVGVPCVIAAEGFKFSDRVLAGCDATVINELGPSHHVVGVPPMPTVQIKSGATGGVPPAVAALAKLPWTDTAAAGPGPVVAAGWLPPAATAAVPSGSALPLLHVLHPLLDVTPPTLVHGFITEAHAALVPPATVPALLRALEGDGEESAVETDGEEGDEQGSDGGDESE